MYEALELYYLVWYRKGEQWLHFNGHFTEFFDFLENKIFQAASSVIDTRPNLSGEHFSHLRDILLP